MLKWLLYMYKKTFRIFTIKNIDGKHVVIIPCNAESKSIKKWFPHLATILYNQNCNKVVLSKTLKQAEGIKEAIYKENVKILDGSILKQNMLIKIVEYISNELNVELKNTEITLLVNEYKKAHIERIISLAEKAKNIKIVTNNIEEFKSLEQKLQERFGILIRLTNNKRKGLVNSNIIINLDFPEELVNKYTINPDAIVVNLESAVKIKYKKFSGINANNIKINLPKQYRVEFEKANIYNDFEESELYEAELIDMGFEEVQQKLKTDKVYVKGLIGKNGIIDKKEFKEKCEIYVKTIDKMSILN